MHHNNNKTAMSVKTKLSSGMLPPTTLSPNSPAGKEMERRLSKLAISSLVLPLAPGKKPSNNASVQDTTTEVVEKTLCYYEFDSGRKIRRRLNFASPRTSEAAAQLGVTFSDCVIK